MATTTLHATVDKDIKEEASRVFQELGLTLSSGIDLYLRAVVRARGIPFDLTLAPSVTYSVVPLGTEDDKKGE